MSIPSVPFQETSNEIWDKKYRLKSFDGELVDLTREDTFKRVARALANVEKEEIREEWYEKFLWAMESGATPGGRILSNAGSEKYKPRTSLINCLAGETAVETKKGVFTIRDLAVKGKEVEVLNGNGNWSKVLFKSFGLQPVVALTFQDEQGALYGIRATKQHEWVLANGERVTTSTLLDRKLKSIELAVCPTKGKKWSFVSSWWAESEDRIYDTTEVFCCEEPETHSFCLTKGLLTGNCVMSKDIDDSIEGIGQAVKEAGIILSTGSGLGYDFSTLRPKGAFINGVGATTSGALPFMDIFDAMCRTIASAGGRRGAEMAMMRDNHPDIIEYISAKREDGRLRQFNMSIAVSDAFMRAVEMDLDWDLIFPIKRKELEYYQLEDRLLENLHPLCKLKISSKVSTGEKSDSLELCFSNVYVADDKDDFIFDEKGRVLCKVYNTVKAKDLWDLIMRSAYDYAEPGVFFIDTVNSKNPLWFTETIRSSNPCGEVPLPPFGACLLGSVNLTKFVENPFTDDAFFDKQKFASVVAIFSRLLDNVVDISGLPLQEQINEIFSKRRQGMGIYGLASALTMMKVKYGSKKAQKFVTDIMEMIQEIGVKVAVELAKEKGCAPILQGTMLLTESILEKGKIPKTDQLWTFVGTEIDKTLLYSRGAYIPEHLRGEVAVHGVRYTHHTSIAPTGTMSLAIGNNASGGCEPDFSHSYIRNVTTQGKKTRQPVEVMSYAFLAYKHLVDPNADPFNLPEYFVTADSLTWKEHLDMQCAAQKYTDQSISKCLVAGNRIITNKGALKIEDCGEAIEPDSFSNSIEGLKVLTPSGEWKNVLRHYYGGVKDTIKINFNNGWDVVGTYNHKVMTSKGWKSLKELQIGDSVLFCDRPEYNSEGGLSLPPLEKGATNATDVKVPDKMSPELALILGMLLSDGHLSISHGRVGITNHKTEILDLFMEEASYIFGQGSKKVMDKRSKIGTSDAYITSRRLVRWLQDLIGYRAGDKHVPEQILMGSREEMEFLLMGISLDGYSAQHWTVLYDGKSQQLAKDIFSIAATLGYRPSFGKKYVKTHDYYVYSVRVPKFNLALEEHKNSNVDDSVWRKVPIPKEFYKLPVLAIYENYLTKLQRVLHKNRTTTSTILASSLARYGLEVPKNQYCVSVTGIEDAGPQKVWDIEVEDSHDYLVDGLYSHNTTNLPTNIPFEEFKEVYTYAYEKGAKGTTVFRYNPATLQGVLQTKKDLEATTYKLIFENGDTKEYSGDTMIEYDGETTSVASLYDAMKEGMYGKF